MTYFHYYATTSRNITDVFKYGLYPLAEIAGFYLFKGDRDKGSYFAKATSALAFSCLTSTFFGLESDMIDGNGRSAVAAEMGKDTKDIKFSDFGQSKNIIISKAYQDIKRLQKLRYGTDAMFMLPILFEQGAVRSGIKLKPTAETRRDPEAVYKAGDMASYFLNGTPVWDMGVYASKSAYWGWETFTINKTSHYEVVKLRENLEATGKDLSANDLLAVYQRTRTDRGLKMVDLNDKESYDALRPLLKKIADAYNKRDGTVTMSEVVYLLGMGKVNVHAADNTTVSQEAIDRSNHEIDKVITIGLEGIQKENQAKDKRSPLAHKTLTDKVMDGAFAVAQTFLGKVSRKRPEEHISIRDPGEITSWNYGINR